MNTTIRPSFYAMSLHELAAWVLSHNGENEVLFDCFPSIDDLDDDEEKEVREEYEGMAEELWAFSNDDKFIAALGPCGK